MKKVFSCIALTLLLSSCGTKVAFTTDATVHSADIGVLRQQDYVVIGFKPDAYFEYRGPVNYVPVGKGLRGSEPSFTFGSDAAALEHQVSFSYLSPTGMNSRTVSFVPEQVEEVTFSRAQGILLRPRSGSALVQPRAEARMCTE